MAENKSLSALSAKVDKKRKRHAEEQVSKVDKAEGATTAGNNPVSSEGPSKKKQKQKQDKNRNKDKSKNKQDSKQTKPAETSKERDGKDGIDESIQMMNGQLLADHFAQKAKKHNKELTAVELNDLYIPEQAFLDTTSFESTRNLDKLPDFLKAFSQKDEDLSKAPEEKGAPHTLVVAAAGLRAADLVRALRSFSNKESMVGKLFAKHIKLDEAKQFCERARMGFGVGTPVRLIDLIDSEALKLTEVKRIVVDGSHIDQKKRGIFDMKEIYLPLLKLLTRPEFRERYGAKTDKIQILMF